ncbi:MAG TPA: hypothetical protein VNH46_07360, partial [Gemmatimonadales bacterium]|nr:hypothetical protein [Gemmatimonadales bacterium]
FAEQPVARLVDGFGNGVSQAGVIISVTVASGGGSLGGITGVATEATGVATFSGLSLVGLVGSKTLGFGATGLGGATSNPFTLSVGAASKLGLTTAPPTSVVNGATLSPQPVVQIQDVGGNPVSQSGVNITAAITGSPGGVSLGTTLVEATQASGAAAYVDLALTGTVGTYTLTFSGGGFTPVTSAAIGLQAGPPASITANSAVTQSGRVGAAVATPPSVVVRDGSGNAVANASVTFQVSAGGGTVTGGSQTTDALGVATVSDWTLGKTVVANTLTATTGALPAVNFDATPAFVVSRVAGGAAHTCAITVDGVPYCWGDNSTGAVGDGTITPRPTPTAVSTALSLGAIFAGRAYSCGLTGAGAAYCWGANNTGQLGIGSLTEVHQPTAVSGGAAWVGLGLSGASGDIHTCGVSTGGSLACWGSDLYGQLGNGTTSTTAVTAPLTIASGYGQATAGTYFSCGVTAAGAGRCWGLNNFGNLGDSTKTQRTSPTAVKDGLTFVKIVASQVHSCGLTSAQTVYCWGYNGNGRLAQDTLTVTEATG